MMKWGLGERVMGFVEKGMNRLGKEGEKKE